MMNRTAPRNGICPMCNAPVDDHVRGGIDLNDMRNEIRVCPQGYWLSIKYARTAAKINRISRAIAIYGTILACGIWLGRHREEVLAFIRSLP